MPPVKASVVRIVDYRKQEFLDRHQPSAAHPKSSRPFLLLLSPDTLSLVTSDDAEAGPTSAQRASQQGGGGAGPAGPAGQEKVAARLPTTKPAALLHKLAGSTHHRRTGSSGSVSGGGGDVGAAVGGAASAGAGGASGGGGTEDGSVSTPEAGTQELEGPLEEGQLLSFSIALSQVSDIEREGRRIKVLFARQRPHRSTESNDEWKYLMKGVFFPLLYPWEAAKHRNWGVGAFMGRHRRDPFLSSVCMEADSPQEAAALHQAMEGAIARLAQALQWLYQDIPFDCRPVVTLVTARGGMGADGWAGDGSWAGIRSPSPSPSPSPNPGFNRAGAAGGAGVSRVLLSPVRSGSSRLLGEAAGQGMDGGGGIGTAGSDASGADRIVSTFPQLKHPLLVPVFRPAPLGAGHSDSHSGGSGEERAPTAADSAAAASAGGDLVVSVWLHSPLGAAVAAITPQHLQASASAGGAPVTVVATPQEEPPSPAVAAAAASREKLEVLLQYSATWHPVPHGTAALQQRQSWKLASSHQEADVSAVPEAAVAGGGSWRGSNAAGTSTGGDGSSGGGGGGSRSAWGAMLAVLVVLLAAWLQLLLSSPASPTVGILHSVCFLVSCLAAVVAIVVLHISSQPKPPQQLATAAPKELPPPLLAGHWRLLLLHADLIRESQSTAGAPAVQRVVESELPAAAPVPSASAAVLPPDEGRLVLPEPIRLLVEGHPKVLSEDIAARFLIGVGHANKAYQAMCSMLDWVESQGVADLVRQPQPRFDLIRATYPQVFYCWSTTSDCVLEVECTGRWRAAFDALKAAGVGEEELMRHQFFCMEYAFRVLDPRPLPQGKTVKIIDLDGLSMRDVSSTAFKWYLQVGGALLAVNYPQRLHKAFLVNAPTWSGVIWRVLAGFIPRRTREQLMLFTKNEKQAAAEALMQWVPAEQLPVAYGGKCSVPLNQCQLEQDMLQYVRKLNRSQPPPAGTASDAAASSLP